ncbi:hypothetical protein GWK47_021532 [Chionoecetes opilio]|uniref:Uncharacterized protein n=1 Tax=Chionoecetes opilio TaxID=41210 RepID=A0A8J4XP52_CHIOP|nr:hypothetical protein GWK47_021532 [Chionoecetes opilio]
MSGEPAHRASSTAEGGHEEHREEVVCSLCRAGGNCRILVARAGTARRCGGIWVMQTFGGGGGFCLAISAWLGRERGNIPCFRETCSSLVIGRSCLSSAQIGNVIWVVGFSDHAHAIGFGGRGWGGVLGRAWRAVALRTESQSPEELGNARICSPASRPSACALECLERLLVREEKCIHSPPVTVCAFSTTML